MRERNDFLTRMRRPHMPSLQMQAVQSVLVNTSKIYAEITTFFSPQILLCLLMPPQDTVFQKTRQI
jgi:hypothetical protein